MKRTTGTTWTAAAILIVMLGIAGAALAGRGVAHRDATTSRHAFEASSAEVASTLMLALQHEDDLVVAASAYVVSNPMSSNLELGGWLRSERAFSRYPELIGLGVVEIVPAASLPSFVRRLRADPTKPLGTSNALQIVPPGVRPYYCLISTMQMRDPRMPVPPPGYDACGVGAPVLQSSRDTGNVYRSPFVALGITGVAIIVPAYRGGARPSTVARRRGAFLGAISAAFVPSVILQAALAAHPTLALVLHQSARSQPINFKAGNTPHDAQRTTIDLHDGSTVTMLGAVASDSVLADGHALVLVAGGTLLSLALAALVLVLGLGRTRARRLVDIRTGELRATLGELAQTELEREALLARTVEIADVERTAIGGALHDGPIQHLTALAFSLDLLGGKVRKGDHRAANTLAKEIRANVDAEIASLRRLVGELRRTLDRSLTPV